jgi:hypothetical protein
MKTAVVTATQTEQSIVATHKVIAIAAVTRQQNKPQNALDQY